MDVTIPCGCPPLEGKPRHESDTVTIRATVDFPTAVLLQKSIQVKILEKRDAAELMAALTRFYVRHCIEAWTLVDESGKGIEVTPENIEARLESNLEAAMLVAEATDAAYAETVLPLVTRAFASLQPTPTSGSTSATTNGSPKRRKRSKRSSTSTIPMVVTGSITGLPAGVSSSLPSSASVE